MEDNFSQDGKHSFEKASGIYNEENFWRQNLYIALSPLFACGLPIHIMPSINSQEELKNEDMYPFEWKTWFRFRFKTRLSSWMTILLSPVYFISTSYLAFLIGRIIVDWLIRGKLTLLHFIDIGNILSVGPFVMTVNYIWLGGHAIASMLRSLLRPIWIPEVCTNSPNEVSNAKESTYWKGNNPGSYDQVNIATIKTEIELQGFRSYMIRSYVLWTVTHVVHVLILHANCVLKLQWDYNLEIPQAQWIYPRSCRV
ncbi:unnamed protein product [Allacma fusca]|uniref:Uncharacterized protein n=1 Tax=Allacma fusca TaxID=39272 RepID=A0A8J2Q580_9HEXA|nr:unnamed protein product [Allacma fusca]